MDSTVTVTQEELQCLRRHYQEGLKMLQGLGVREQAIKASPKLTKEQQAMQFYEEKLKELDVKRRRRNKNKKL